eukprot:5797189-Amphidinium_carterae.1
MNIEHGCSSPFFIIWCFFLPWLNPDGPEPLYAKGMPLASGVLEDVPRIAPHPFHEGVMLLGQPF